MGERNLAPGEWAVLALLSEQPAHGWAVASQLDQSGELGLVWSLGRPLVYRSIDVLAERKLIEPVRDVRSLLLLKLIFAERAGADPRPMLTAQHKTIAVAVKSLEARIGA